MPVARLLLRLLSVLGPLTLVGWELAFLPPFKPRQDWGLIVLFLMGLAALGFLMLVTPRAIGIITRHPDLLVPLGVTTALGGAVDWLGSRPGFAAVATPLWHGSLLGLSLAISAAVLIAIVLAVLHAGWTTALILQAVTRGRIDLLAPLANPGRWFLRTFAALTVGVAGLMLLVVVALAVAAVALPLGLILIAVGSLVWNLSTAALLPATLRSRGPLAQCLAEGFRESRRGLRRWWGVVVLQMILLGWVTFLHFSYTINEPGRTTSYSTTNWNVNGFWTGGYEAGCKWYEQVAKVAQTETLPPVVTLLGLLLGIVAVAVKLTVAQRMDWWAEVVDEAVADPSRAEPSRVPAVTRLVLAAVAVGLVIALCGGLIFHQQLSEALVARQFRRAVAQGESPEALDALLAGSENGLELAGRLSEDADPRVRRAVVGYLVSSATPAQKRERRFGAFGETWTGFNVQAVPPLKRLLDDPDAEVRQAAIRAVGERRAVEEFREPLLGLLRGGEVTDRVAVAESLAHWDPSAFLQTFADRGQPKEVRLALLRGTERYGWARVAEAAQFQQTLEKCLHEPDRELRHAAIDALRHAVNGPSAWLGILQAPDAGDRRIVFQTWVDALVSEPVYPGEQYPLLDKTEGLLFDSGVPVRKPPAGGKDQDELDGARIAPIVHVLCAAARETTAFLDRTAPANLGLALQDLARGGGPAMEAFAQELHRLQLVLRALAAVGRFAADPRCGRTAFTLLMPDEPAAPPPPRKLRDFLLADVKEPLGWCRRHGGGYASPFLRVNSFWFGHADPGGQSGQSQTLGQVLEAMHMHTDAALAQYIKDNSKE
jgi:hypothetical protein